MNVSLTKIMSFFGHRDMVIDNNTKKKLKALLNKNYINILDE